MSSDLKMLELSIPSHSLPRSLLHVVREIIYFRLLRCWSRAQTRLITVGFAVRLFHFRRTTRVRDSSIIDSHTGATTNSLSARSFFARVSNPPTIYAVIEVSRAHLSRVYIRPQFEAAIKLAADCSLCFRYSSLALAWRLLLARGESHSHFITRRQSCHASRNLRLALYV